MTTSSPRIFRFLVPIWLSVATLPLGGAPAVAQLHGNPFDPYQAAYRSSSLPTYTTIGPMRIAPPPGLGTVPGYGGFTSTERFRGSLGAEFGPYYGGGGFGWDAGLGPVAPYYRSHRQYDEQFGRVYRPNDTDAERAYYENLEQRERLYFQAMSETDPAKKAELMRQYRQASERAAMSLSRAPRRGGGNNPRHAPRSRTAGGRRFGRDSGGHDPTHRDLRGPAPQ